MKIFKKAVGIICAAAMLVSCFAMTMFVSAEDTNIALASNGATPISSGQRNGSQSEAKINDGSNDGFFGANVGNIDAQGTVYFGVKWEENKTFGDLKIYWRDTNHGPATDAYTIEYSIDGTNWQNVDATKVRTSISKEDMQTLFGNLDNQSRIAFDTVTLSEDVTAKAVRVRATVGSLSQIQMYELEVYGTTATGGEVPNPNPGGGEDDDTPAEPTNVASLGEPELTGSITRGNVKLDNLNDDDKTTRTVTTKAPAVDDPAYAGIKWTESYDISKVVVTWYAPTAIGEARYVLQASTDGGATYTDVTAMFARDTLTDTLTLSAPVSANALRIVITAKAETATGNLSICEIEAIGTPSFTNGGGGDEDDEEEVIPTTNIAPLGNAFEDSHRNSNDQSYINDKMMSEGKKWWQSQKVFDKDNDDAYAGIKWRKPVSFKHLTIYWRDCGRWTTEDYVIQISTDGGRTWTTVEAVKTREDLGTQTYAGVECDRVFKDTVVLTEEAEATAVRIYLADGDKTVQMYELEIYGDAGDNANTGVESNAMWIVLLAAATLACLASVIAPKLSYSK